MRYFDDGDLTEGLHIASKPYPFDLILGYWHAVSTYYEGERNTVDYDNPDSPAMFRLQIEAIDGRATNGDGKGKGKGKRQREDSLHDDILVTLKYRDWELEYTGVFNTDGPATNLYLSNNDTPEAGDVDKEATLAFGTVLDDRGYPFLRIGMAACEADSGVDDFQDIEIVAKKTDTQEVHKLELSKNERLRLGFAVRSNGQFEDIVGMGEPTDSYEALTRQLSEYTAASARIAKQLTVLRARMDEQLRDAAESGNQIRSIYHEHRQSLPAQPASSLSIPASAQLYPVSAPRPSTFPRPTSNSGPPGAKRAFDQRRNSSAYSTPASNTKDKRYCPVCDKTVSLSHGAWTKHVTSQRHADLTAQHGPTSAPAFGYPSGLQNHITMSEPRPENSMTTLDQDGDFNGDFDDTAGEADTPTLGLTTRHRSAVASGEQPRKRRRRSSGRKGPTRLCEDCNCQISIKNWNVHAKSEKHKNNERARAQAA